MLKLPWKSPMKYGSRFSPVLRCRFFVIALILSVTAVGEAGTPQDVTFRASVDGTEQKYVLVVPDEPLPEKVDLLIALHGHGRDRWQFINADFGGARAAREIAQKYGMIYVSPDYRAKTSWMGPHAEADLQQIIAEIQQQYPVQRVYLSGASMGGSSVLTYAALHPDEIAGVISMNGTANHLEFEGYQDAIISSFGGTKAAIPDEYKKRSAEYWPERFVMPISCTTGGEDKAVPASSVTRLVKILQHLNRPVLHIHRDNGGHSTTYEDAMQAFEFVIKETQQ